MANVQDWVKDLLGRGGGRCLHCEAMKLQCLVVLDVPAEERGEVGSIVALREAMAKLRKGEKCQLIAHNVFQFALTEWSELTALTQKAEQTRFGYKLLFCDQSGHEWIEGPRKPW